MEKMVLWEALRAFDEGQEVECRSMQRDYPSEWIPLPKAKIFPVLKHDLEFRIKPKPLELWVSLFQDGKTKVYTSVNDACEYGLFFNGYIRTVHMREVEGEK